jgi:rhodanese-related sulfurtransferase
MTLQSLFEEAVMTMQVQTISATQLHRAMLDGQVTALLDVRSPAEFRDGHVPGAKSLPLNQLESALIPSLFGIAAGRQERPMFIICKSGPRAVRAAERLSLAGYSNLRVVGDGTEGWARAGFALNREGGALSLERQVQIAVGSLSLLTVLLGLGVHPGFLALTAAISAGLIIAGITRWCGMAEMIAQMPWNRTEQSGGHAKA